MNEDKVDEMKQDSQMAQLDFINTEIKANSEIGNF